MDDLQQQQNSHIQSSAVSSPKNFVNSPETEMLPPLGVVLLLLATLLCPPAMAQFPQQQGWPYSNQYQYQQQQQPNTFYRQFGAQTPYGSYAPTFGPRSFGGGASSPYSAANSYYGYGTNSPAFYQQNRVPADCSPFGQNPFGGGAGGYPRYPFYPQQQQQFAGGQGHQQYLASPPMVAGQQPSAFYSHQSPAAFSPPFDSMPFGGTGHFDDGFHQLGERQKRILRQKRQTNDGKDDRRARRQAAADEDEFSGFSINLPLMSVAVPEMPNPIASSKCNVQKNPEEGDYFMALQFVC